MKTFNLNSFSFPNKKGYKENKNTFSNACFIISVGKLDVKTHFHTLRFEMGDSCAFEIFVENGVWLCVCAKNEGKLNKQCAEWNNLIFAPFRHHHTILSLISYCS